MPRIEITPTSVVIHVEEIDRILVLNARPEVPLEHVSGVDATVLEAHRIWKGWTVAGRRRL
jgi:hypothetical protein